MCNKCGSKEICGCNEVDSKCVIYNGICLDTLNVCKGDNLQNIIKIIDDLLTQVFYDIRKGITLTNIGDGERVVKNDNTLTGDYEIRSIKKGDESIDILTEDDNIIFSINKDWLAQQIPDLPPPTEVNITSPKDTIKVSDRTKIDVNFGAFITDDDKLLEVVEENNKLVFKVKTQYLLRSIGTGESIFSGVDIDGRNKIRTLKIESTNLDVSIRSNDVEGTVLIVNSYPEDPSMKYFYVSANYTGTVEDGSMGKPYKTLDSAISAFVHTGTNSYPFYSGVGKIVLLSNIEYTKKLSTNNLNIDCNGYSIQYKGTDNYIIDTEYIAQNVVGMTSGNLNNNVGITFHNLSLILETQGAINHKPMSSSNNKVAQIALLDNTKIVDRSHIKYQNLFTPVKKANGEDATMFGSVVKKSNTYNLNIPIIKTEGISNLSGEGTLKVDNLELEMWGNTALKMVNTSLSMNNLKIGINIYNIVYDSLFDGRIPYSKAGVHVIDSTDSWLKANSHFDETSSYSELSPSGVRHSYRATSLESYIKMTKTTNSGKGQSITITNGYTYGGAGKYFIKMTKGSTLVLEGSDISEFICFNTFALVEDGTLPSQSNGALSLSNSSVKYVDTSTNLNISSPFSTINGAMFTTTPSYTDDDTAKTVGGLIKNNIYFNTTTKALKKVES